MVAKHLINKLHAAVLDAASCCIAAAACECCREHQLRASLSSQHAQAFPFSHASLRPHETDTDRQTTLRV